MQTLKKVKQTIIKKGFTVINSQLTEASNNLKYYENRSVELQEEINNINKNHVWIFKNGEYIDEICIVYYEMLQSNVGVVRCGQLLIMIWIKYLKKKSLAATMLVEIEALSKMQVFEENENGDQNILHIYGTKYYLEEMVLSN